MKIKDLPAGDRPREKAIERGLQALSDSELLALIINTGTATQSSLSMAQFLLKEFSSLKNIARLSVNDLQSRLKGIGPAKAVQICATFELSRRVGTKEHGEPITIHSPEDIARIYLPRLRDENQELFFVVSLNSANKIIRDRVITKGLVNSTQTHPREVFREAIIENATSVIILHNHPSKNPEPSREDIAITRQLVEAGKIIGIPVHDHIIIAGDEFTSLMEKGLM